MSIYEQKTVHVNSYTKNDGTHVKEHYRGIGNSNGIMPEKTPEYRDDWGTETKNPLDKLINILTGKDTGTQQDSFNMNAGPNIVLSGGVSTSNIDFSNILSAVLSVGSIALTVGITAAQVAGKLYKAGLIGNISEKAKLKPQLNTEIQKIKETQNLADKIEKNTLNKLVNTKNQQEYSELYKTLAEQRDLNQKNRLAISRIEYASEHEDYQTVLNELNNYQSNYKTAEAARTISSMPSMDPNRAPVKSNTPKYSKLEQLRRTGLHKAPYIEKLAINAGMNYYEHYENCPDANAFWQAAVAGFKNSSEYIAENSYYLIDSTKQLPRNIRTFVQAKVLKQIGKVDAPGIILRPDCRLTQEIVHSPEFKNFLDENFSSLIEGNVVNGSTYFGSSKNLALALGHADITNLHIDAEGNLKGYVIDTYDFNKDDPMWQVEWAHNLQERGEITNFYTINVLSIPKEVWTQIILNK